LGTAQAQTPTASPTPAAERFPVKAARIEGNTLLPEDRVAPLVTPLIGSERTLADLRRAAATVQETYRDAGYGGVVAFVPEQDLSAGNVVIRVLEGKLARVKISGNQRYDEANIRQSLPNLRQGETPWVRAIDRDIQLANENPVKQLRVVLTAGQKPAEIDANIEVAEDNPLRFLVGFDSTGTEATGNYRLSVGIQHANLWNRDHIATFQYQTSPSKPDLVQIYSLGYRLPLYGLSATIDALFAHSNVDNGTTTTPAGPLQFTGKGDVVALRANRYLVRLGEYDHRLTLGVDWRNYDNQCSLGSFGAAGCGPAAASVTVLPLSLTYTAQVQGPELSWGYSAALAQNVGGSDQAEFNAVRVGAPKNYSVLRLSAFANRSLPAGFGVQARVSTQYSRDALIPGEQFGLGGANSVLGYRERELAGDRGFYANLEGLGPDFGNSLKTEGLNLRPVLFAHWGRLANHLDTPCALHHCSISSVGVGLRFALGKTVSGRFDLGYALQEGVQTRAGDTRGDIALLFVF
jgi:hemolysin activation/secretion protein